MKFLLLMALLTGCASYHQKGTAPVGSPPKSADTSVKVQSLQETGAVWEVLNEKLVLQFTNIDDGKNATLILDHGISVKPLSKGHWELSGFEFNGRSYVSMNTTKKFVVNIRPKDNTYAGSYLAGCPRVPATDLKLLKGMKFFNRYPFSSSHGLCELIVGNNFLKVKKEKPLKRMKVGF